MLGPVEGVGVDASCIIGGKGGGGRATSVITHQEHRMGTSVRRLRTLG